MIEDKRSQKSHKSQKHWIGVQLHLLNAANGDLGTWRCSLLLKHSRNQGERGSDGNTCVPYPPLKSPPVAHDGLPLVGGGGMVAK